MEEMEFINQCIRQAMSAKAGPNGTDPKVGAVVVKDGVVLGRAFRGQEEPGQHAEFTLVHKILRSRDRLSGATIYTTLEPCTHRSHDKLPCADWIIQKGIRRVVIGLLDPNPTICGRGYWRLVSSGLEVEFFPWSKVQEVREMNKGFIEAHLGGPVTAPLFAWAVQNRKDHIISPYPGLGWGDSLSLQESPGIRDGWPASKVRIRLYRDPFVAPRNKASAYKQFVKGADRQASRSAQSYMLTKNPVSFSDAPDLSLTVRPVAYNLVQFSRNTIATIGADRSILIDDLVRGSLSASFAHSLCMHVIIVTSDKKVLLTQRSPKVDYYPETWSASIEEQFSAHDLTGPRERAISHWASRSLKEELGLTIRAYHEDNFRILSVFLEGGILNCSVCGYVELRITSHELETVLRGMQRTDYEFIDWRFLDLDKETILGELFQPSRVYHPTVGYRLLQTYLKNFGVPSDAALLPFVTK
jgi:pyrimidine deaminase RibD-like protein